MQADQNMNVDMDTVMSTEQSEQSTQRSQNEPISSSGPIFMPPPSLPGGSRDFREIQVKVHIRRPERDAWVYQGRGIVSQEIVGHSSRVVVRSASSRKVMVAFNETTDLQAEKRGNFVVVGVVDGPKVVSWSLNALNNSETLRLLASIELACYKCRQAVADPRMHNKLRRKIERVIKDDKRRRHRRRKDQEALIDAFSKQKLDSDPMSMEPTADISQADAIITDQS